MDKIKIKTVILIVVVGISSIILGIIFANITHFISGKSKNVIQETSLDPEAPKDTILTENQLKEPAAGPDLYETCILISTDRNIIMNNKDVLENNGYLVRIKESKRANKLIFSLIIDKQFSKEDAILIGEEVKERFPLITTYWVEKISGIEAAPEELFTENIKDNDRSENFDEIEAPGEIEEEKAAVEKYEVQILANTDMDRVEAVKMLLETEGYKLKILEFKNNGITYYRLRLAGEFSLDEGKRIGEELMQKFKFLDKYWLDKKL